MKDGIIIKQKIVKKENTDRIGMHEVSFVRICVSIILFAESKATHVSGGKFQYQNQIQNPC